MNLQTIYGECWYMNKGFYGYLLMLLIVLSSISAVSASDVQPDEVFGTYMKMDSYTVHKGDPLQVKVELFGEGTGYLWSDEWISSATIKLIVKDGNRIYQKTKSTTDLKGNAYLTVDTSELNPGTYELKSHYNGDWVFRFGYSQYAPCNCSSTLTVAE